MSRAAANHVDAFLSAHFEPANKTTLKAPREAHTTAVMPPRLLRASEAAPYLGLGRNEFNGKVRPFLTKIRLTTQIVVYDIQEIDELIDDLRTGKKALRKKGEVKLCELASRD
jgi:hypothetical protein